MTGTIQHPPSPPKPRRGAKAIGCCCGTPVLFALVLFLVYTYNNRFPDIKVPTHTMPADNARDYFHRAYLASTLMKHKSPYDMAGSPAQDDTLSNYRGCAQDAEPVLTVLREGLKREYMNPPDRSYEAWADPSNREQRELARVDGGAADYYDVSGQPGCAMQMHLDGIEMGVMIPRGGGLNAEFVGDGCESIAEQHIEPLIPRLSTAELLQAAARLNLIALKRVPYSDIVREEGYISTSHHLELLYGAKAKPIADAVSLARGFGETEPTLRQSVSDRTQSIRFLISNKTTILRENASRFAALAEEVRLPYMGESKVLPPDNLLAGTFGSAANDGRKMWLSRVAALELIRDEVALYRYHDAYHRFPPALPDLCPQFLSAVPVDPFGGGRNEPMKYHLKPDGSFLLYSVGPDMKDDGGIPGKYLSQMPGDIVAGRLHKNSPILYSGPSKTQ